MHWRGLIGNRTYFDCADLGGKDLLVQIESARPGTIPALMGRPETRVVLVKFVGHERPLAFKATLAKAFVSLHGTGDIDQWAGRWLWLTAAMVPDPSGGRSAMTEAVRISPRKPSDQDISAAMRARGGATARPASTRNEADDEQRAQLVLEAIDAAGTTDEVEGAIAPHRDELKLMSERIRSIVASAKKARLATIASAGKESQ